MNRVTIACLASLILGFPAAAQQQSQSPQRIRVFVASDRMVDGNLELVTHTQGVAAFQEQSECEGLRVTNRIDRAHFLLTLERFSGTINTFGLNRRNDVSVYDGWGDMVYAGSTRQLGNAAKDACNAIREEIESGAELVTMQESNFR